MGKAIELRKPLTPQRSFDVANHLVKTCLKETETKPRRVNFAEKRSVRRYKKNYDQSDYNNIWYSQRELKAIADENTRVVKRESKKAGRDKRGSHFQETDDWSWRGFEYAIHRYGKLRIRSKHIDCVLKFQNKTRGKRPGDLALADVASRSSTSNGSVLRARSHAVRDELEMQRIHKEADKKGSGYRRSKTF